ncbi:MAG: hypothetical protein WEA80_04910 [Gemmatimonadaceae bacterium]
MTGHDFLRRLVTAFDQIRIPYMVTGSFASSAHGRVRATEDIDVVIAPTPQQLLDLLDEFPADRFYADRDAALAALRQQSQFNIIDVETAWKADLIIRKEREFSRTEFQRRHAYLIDGLRVYLATAEDVLIAKLEWARAGGSERQIEDAAGIIESQGGGLDTAYVERWVRELRLDDEWRKARESTRDAGRGLS